MTKKYRKKPAVVEALQWTGKNSRPMFDFLTDTVDKPILLSGASFFISHEGETGSCVLNINTLEGIMRAAPGDYIIKGVKGEFYPCKPDIFEATYEEYSDAMNDLAKQAIELVVEERERQNAKWKDQTGNHPFAWMSILMEEVGELAEAVNETCFATAHTKRERGGRLAILKEAIQVAAVATAIAESVLADRS